MLSLFKRKPKTPVEAEPVEPNQYTPDPYMEAEPEEPVRRMKQQNIKVSEDCCAIFAALAEAEDMSKAELFEDMVAERYETLRRRGIDVATLNH
jgi:ribbon-helix-helix CopG family protein